jgi:hypothetical protein
MGRLPPFGGISSYVSLRNQVEDIWQASFSAMFMPIIFTIITAYAMSYCVLFYMTIPSITAHAKWSSYQMHPGAVMSVVLLKSCYGDMDMQHPWIHATTSMQSCHGPG